MPALALGLVLVAAVLHAGWNFLLKQADEHYIVMWWALVIGSLCGLPVIFFTPFPQRIWPYAIASAVFEAIYFTVLTAAYRIGDFSLVYPIARGTAPALLTAWSMLWLNETPRLAGLVGLMIIVLGLMVVASSPWFTTTQRSVPTTTALGLACFVALCVSLYSVIDGAAVQVVPPLPYTALMFALTTVLLTPHMVRRHGRQALLAAWYKQWPRMTTIGICMVGAYMLVVSAYALAPVSYTGAIREISIILAGVLGWRWLGESFGRIRLIGSVFIFSGIMLIAIAG